MLRKVWHLLGLIFPAAYYFGVCSREVTLWILAAAVVLVAIVEIGRFLIPAVNRVFVATFRLIIREEERKGLNASLIYLAGVFLTILAFPKPIACASLAYLGFGDTAAGLVGKYWKVGRISLPNKKSLQGTLACAAVCFGVGILLLPWPLALAGALTATAAELFSPGKWDNGVIPLSAAGAMWLTATILTAVTA
jgi:dolichol kinase